MTRYEQIKNMSVEEMAESITNGLTAHLNKLLCALGHKPEYLLPKDREEAVLMWKQWLEKEVEE